MSYNSEPMVLCGANGYEQKYYLNEAFAGLPESIKQELQVLCVLFTEEVGGIFTIRFEEEGSLFLETECEDSDFYYDEVTSGLMVKKVREKRQELFASLELYYRAVILKEEIR